MKTAISIPDELFQEADDLARRTRTSRSQLYANALREYLGRHSPERLTEAMNEALATESQEPDAFVRDAAVRILRQQEWPE